MKRIFELFTKGKESSIPNTPPPFSDKSNVSSASNSSNNLANNYKLESGNNAQQQQQNTSPSFNTESNDSTLDGEIILKIVFIGGSQVGKTSIIRRYLQDCFTHHYIPTIGIDLSTSKWVQPSKITGGTGENGFESNVINPNYRLQFWDVAHAEVRGKHHANIFKGVAGVVMVFDACNVKSVTALDEWRLAFENAVKLNSNNNTINGNSTAKNDGSTNNITSTANTGALIPMLLLANKSDTGTPVIKSADLDVYCERGGYSMWRFTSARNGNSIDEAIQKFVEVILEWQEKDRELKRVSLKRSGRSVGNTSTKNIEEASPVSSSYRATPSTYSQSYILSPHHGNQNLTTSSEALPTPPQQPRLPVSSQVSSKSLMDEIQISDLENQAGEFYTSLKSELDALFNAVEPMRKSDLQVLECQRFDEYKRFMNNIRKATNNPVEKPNKRIPTKDQLLLTLSENIKKWTNLIMNLNTEISLSNTNLSPITNETFSTLFTPFLPQTPSTSSQRTSRTCTPSIVSRNESITDFQSMESTMMYRERSRERIGSREDTHPHTHDASPEENRNSQHFVNINDNNNHNNNNSNNGNNNGNNNNNINSENANGPPILANGVTSLNILSNSTDTTNVNIVITSTSTSTTSPAETLNTQNRRQSKQRLGFGFKNAGKNTGTNTKATLQHNTIGYILDNDNPISPPSRAASYEASPYSTPYSTPSTTSSISMSSSPASVSPFHSPPDPNHTNAQPPLSLPSSYNLNVCPFDNIKLCDDVMT